MCVCVCGDKPHSNHITDDPIFHSHTLSLTPSLVTHRSVSGKCGRKARFFLLLVFFLCEKLLLLCWGPYRKNSCLWQGKNEVSWTHFNTHKRTHALDIQVLSTQTFPFCGLWVWYQLFFLRTRVERCKLVLKEYSFLQTHTNTDRLREKWANIWAEDFRKITNRSIIVPVICGWANTKLPPA